VIKQGDKETDEHYLARLRAELAEALRRADTAEELLFDSRKREAVLEARLSLTRRHWQA